MSMKVWPVQESGYSGTDCTGYAMLRPFKNQYALICSRISCSLVHKVKKSRFCFLPPICPCLSYTLNPFLKCLLAITGFVCILICVQYFWTILKNKGDTTTTMSSYILLFLKIHKNLSFSRRKNKKTVYDCKSSSTQVSITFLIFWENLCLSTKMTVWKDFQSKCC